MNNTSVSGKLVIAVTLVLALTANFVAIGTNGIRGQKTCRELESIKAPEYIAAKDNLANIEQYKSDYINLFGSKPTHDPVLNKTMPRWEVEYNKAIRRSEERVKRYEPHECPFLFWSNV